MTEFFPLSWQDIEWRALWVLLLILLWPLISWLRTRGQASFPWLAAQDTAEQSVYYHSRIAAFMATQTAGSTQGKQRLAWLSPLQAGLRVSLLGLVLLALAGPFYWQSHPQSVSDSPPVRDVTLVVESSVSLVLEDYAENGQPLSRIAVLQQVLDEFVAALPHHRFSLILYADEAFTLMPMTADRNSLRAELPRLLPYLAGRTDQAMGEAMAMAIRNMHTDPNRSTTFEPLLVVVSDGLQARSRLSLADVIDYANASGIAIHTIGLGGQESLSAGRSSLIYQPLETASLQTLAADTGGRFVAVYDPAELRDAFSQLQVRARDGLVEQGEDWRQISLVHWPLSLALVVGLLLLASGWARMYLR